MIGIINIAECYVLVYLWNVCLASVLYFYCCCLMQEYFDRIYPISLAWLSMCINNSFAVEVHRLVLDRYCASVSTHSLRYSIGEYDISVCVSPPMPSNWTRRATETHGLRRQNVTTKWGRHFYSRSVRTDCGCDARRHQRHPAAQHAAWCFNYRHAWQTHASMSKGQTGSWKLTRWFTTLAFAVQRSDRKRGLHKSFIN